VYADLTTIATTTNLPKLRQYFEVVKVEVRASSVDAFGTVEEGGMLVLKGILRSMVVKYLPKRRAVDKTLEGFWVFAGSGASGDGEKRLAMLKPDYPLLQDSKLAEELEAEGARFTALRMASVVHAKRFWEWALALRQVESDGEGERWERIGIVRYDAAIGDEGMFLEEAVEGAVRII
jgi:hypothetical protein